MVAPYTGAWIEIHIWRSNAGRYGVAPYTGAWIEIFVAKSIAEGFQSLPTRERGLKSLDILSALDGEAGRSLHGSVD